MSASNVSRISSIFCFAFAGLQLMGCGGKGIVSGSAQADNRSQGLQIGAVQSVNGLFEEGRCMNPATGLPRASGSTWSIPLAGNGESAAPQVVLGDFGCRLGFASLDVLDSAGVLQKASPTTPFQLQAQFQNQPMLLSYIDSGTHQTIEFFANAILFPADFSADFQIAVTYGESLDVSHASSVIGQYSTVGTSSISVAGVLAANNSLDFSPLQYEKDAQNLVTSQSADIADPIFTLGSRPGSSYVIVSGACPTTLAATAAAVASVANPLPVTTAPTSADFGLQHGTDLKSPLNKCMIIDRCDVGNVCSYQLLQVTFQ